jgi:3-oxoacyl-[acyl-carrier protein] reductase
MNQDTSQRSVLVTGSSRGIGAAIALRLAQAGFEPVIHYHARRDAAECVAADLRQLGRSPRLVQFDIADREQAKSVIEHDIEQNGAYYGVVCNAGLSADNAFPAMTGDEWDKVLRSNLDGFYNVLHPTIMPMIRARQGGRIITLSSISGMAGNRGQVNYSASKAGIIGATKALALELAKRNITVNCVAPGLIDTDMVSSDIVEHVLPQIPMRRMGNVNEVAAAVAFLMSDEASYITRQVLAINGGML